MDKDYLHITPSLPKCSAYKNFEKSNNIKFDQVCKKKYQHPEYQINITRFIIIYIFVWYIFDIANIDIFLNKLGQS
jgi:hypothetical protein